MAKVKITETILRDGHQSLIATRMTTDEMLPALEFLGWCRLPRDGSLGRRHLWTPA